MIINMMMMMMMMMMVILVGGALTGSVHMARACEASASAARLLKSAPFSRLYSRFLAGSSMTKATTNCA